MDGHLRIEPLLELGDAGVVLGEHVGVGDAAGGGVGPAGQGTDELGWADEATVRVAHGASVAVRQGVVEGP